MATENANFIKELISSQPVDGDFVLEGDDELRQLKRVLGSQLPDLEARGITTIVGTEALPDPNQYIWTPDGLAAWLTLNWAAFAVTPTVLGASFSVNKEGSGSTQSWSNAAIVNWNTSEWDVNGSVDLANDWDEPTEPGIYNYKCAIDMDPNGGSGDGWVRMEFRKTASGGGTTVVRSLAQNKNFGDSFIAQLDALVQMDGVGDKMAVWIDVEPGISTKCFNDAESAWFQGLKVSELV